MAKSFTIPHESEESRNSHQTSVQARWMVECVIFPGKCFTVFPAGSESVMLLLACARKWYKPFVRWTWVLSSSVTWPQGTPIFNILKSHIMLWRPLHEFLENILWWSKSTCSFFFFLNHLQSGLTWINSFLRISTKFSFWSMSLYNTRSCLWGTC